MAIWKIKIKHIDISIVLQIKYFHCKHVVTETHNKKKDNKKIYTSFGIQLSNLLLIIDDSDMRVIVSPTQWHIWWIVCSVVARKRWWRH